MSGSRRPIGWEVVQPPDRGPGLPFLRPGWARDSRERSWTTFRTNLELTRDHLGQAAGAQRLLDPVDRRIPKRFPVGVARSVEQSRPDPTDPAQADEVEQLLADTVADAERQVVDRPTHASLEDPGEATRGEQEPVGVLHLGAQVSGPDAKALGDLDDRLLAHPRLEDRGRLQRGQERIEPEVERRLLGLHEELLRFVGEA